MFNMYIKKQIFIIICVITFFLPFQGLTQVEITIDAGQEKRIISPYIYGKNNSLSDASGSPLSQAEWQKLRDLGITMFRENGGNNSTKYNWKRKLSSHPDWYNNVYNHNWDFAAQSLQQNIPSAQGMWSFQLIGKSAKTSSANFGDWNYNRSQWWSGVNQNLAGGGVVNTAGGSVALQDGDPDLYLENWPSDSTVAIIDHWFDSEQLGLDSAKIRYWGMDNEPEIWNGTHDDITKEQPSAEEFMQLYFEVAKKARAKFPGIKICGPVPANEWQWYNWNNDVISYNNKKYTWLEYFILRIAEEQKVTGIRLLDVLDIHFYPGETNAEDIVQLHRVYFDKNYVYPGANGVHRIGGGWNTSINKEYIFERCNEWLTKYIGENHGVTFGVSETGINSNNPNVTANWYASTLGEFAKQGVDFFTPWSWETGMYEVLHLFSRYGKEYFIDGVSSEEQYVSAYPTLNENADSITLFLVNRHLTQKKTVRIDLQNFSIKNNPIQMYSLSNLPAGETFVSHNQNALKTGQIHDSKDFVEVELEPLSVNALFFEAAPLNNSEIKKNGFDLKIYPNPTSNKTNIEFYLEKKETVTISLFNSNGQKIIDLTKADFHSGKQNLTFNLSALPNGIYWIQIQSIKQTQTNKIILHH